MTFDPNENNPFAPTGQGLDPKKNNPFIEGSSTSRSSNPPPPTADALEATSTEQQTQDATVARELNPTITPPPPTAKLPFGALGVDEFGTPYYGHGLQGWVRQTFADLFDPQKSIGDIKLTSQEREELDATTVAAQEKLDAYFGELGIDLEKTGLDTQTVTEGLVPFMSEKSLMFAHGESKLEVGLEGAGLVWRFGRDLAQRMAWGLLDLTGLDWAMRSLISTEMAVKEFAKESADGPLPLIFGSKLASVAGVDTMYNIGNLAKKLISGEVKFGALKEKVQDYNRASEMAYTMIVYKDRIDRLDTAIAKGVDPGVAARNLQNPLVELAGSIFGDPTNYLGAAIPTLAKVGTGGEVLASARFGLREFKIGEKAINLGFNLPWQVVGRVPEFGELISPAIKLGRYRQEANAVQFITPEPIFEKLIRNTADAPTANDAVRALRANSTEAVQRLRVVDEASALSKARQEADQLFEAAEKLSKNAKGQFQTAEAAAKMDEAKLAVKTADNALKEWSKGAKNVVKSDYGIAVMNSSGKASVIARDMTLVVSGALMATGSPSVALNMLHDLRTLYSATSSEQDAAEALTRIIASKGMGGLLTSKAGRLTGTVLSMLDTAFFDDLMKYADDAETFTDKVFSAFDQKLMKIFPSVDEMVESASRVKIARNKGLLPDVTDIRLAAHYNALPEYVKISNRAVFGWFNKAHGANVKIQSMVYMGWNPGFAVRNVTGQTVLMTMMFGAQDAATLTAKAVGNSVTDSLTTAFITRMSENLKRAGIPIPMEIHKGITEAQSLDVAAKDVRRLAQNNEKATSAAIIEHVAMQEVRKFGAKNAAQLADGLLEDGVIDQSLHKVLTDILKKHDYNEAEAIPEFRQALSGEWRDSFRQIPLPDELHYHLHETGRIEEVYDLQKNATSPQEFQAGLAKIMSDIENGIRETLATEPAMLGEDVKKAYPELLEHHILMQKRIASGEIDVLSAFESDSVAATQAYTKAQTHLEAFVDKIVQKLSSLNTLEGKQASDQLVRDRNLWREWWMGGENNDGVFHQYRKTMDKANQLYDRAKNEKDFVKLWNESSVAGTEFNLAKIYPNVDPSTLDYRSYSNKMWEAYYVWREQHWMTGNEKYIHKQLEATRGALELAGSTLEEFIEANKGGDNPYASYERMLAEAHFWSTRGSIDPSIKKLMATLPPGTTVRQMRPDYFTQAVEGVENLSTTIAGGDVLEEAASLAGGAVQKKRNIFDVLGVNSSYALNQVNKDRRLKGLAPVADIADAEVGEVINSVLKRAKNKVPYPYAGHDSFARAWWEATPSLKRDMKYWESQVADNWGAVEKVTNLSPEQEAAFSKRLFTYGSQMTEVRNMSVRLGVGIRDKLLFDYRKTYADMALGYLKPFGYWTNRAYATTLEMVAANPVYGNTYRAIRKFSEREHAGMPDYYKQMMGLKLPGVDGELFFNFEANLNPVYSLTGTDFNDPKKRVDALSRAVDDMGKIGGANNTIINWAMAMYLSAKGEKEASRRWAGRAFPATSVVKALLNLNVFNDKDLLQLLGVDDIAEDNWFVNKFIRHGDFDPITWATSNTNMDAYEEGRVNNALAQMALNGQITQEQALDASIKRGGDTWNLAAQTAVDQRAAGNIVGFVGGPGFRGRSEADVQIEVFYSQYYQLVSMKSMMTSEQYRVAWDKLREGDNGKMMDVLLIGRMSGQDRDEALAYNVLGRLPPGSMSDIAQLADMPAELISKFYENKGFDGWSQQDINNFNNKVLDLHAYLSIPDSATKQEWTQAKNTYSAMQAEMQKRYGDNILDRINSYFRDPDQPISPDVQEALKFQTAMLVNNPVMAKYYGGISQIERYYYNQVWGQLDKEFPNASKYVELWSTLNMQGNAREAKLVYKQYNLEAYFAKMSVYSDFADKKIVEMGAKLPEAELPLRADFVPDSAVQNQLAERANQFPTWDDLTEDMPDILQENVRAYFESGKKLNYASESKLKHLAKKLGYSDWEEYLRYLGISLQR